MGEYKTPGVYIKEKNAFGSSVVEVETAVPAFVGYTEKALNGTEDLTGKPWKITSMAEFIQYFGGMRVPKYTVAAVADGATPAAGGNSFTVNTFDGETKRLFSIGVDNNYTLYLNMLLFFANGGGPCYVVSVGSYESEFKSSVLSEALTALKSESEPTMVVIPEAVNFAVEDCVALQQAMADHCGDQQNRVAILDVFIDRYPQDPTQTVDYADNFRNAFSTAYPSYVAAYFPYLATSVLSEGDITSDMIVFSGELKDFLASLGLADDQVAELLKLAPDGFNADLHQALMQNSPVYSQLVKAILANLNLLPPSAAMAGVYATTDKTRGVWKAPANVSINSIVKPSITINDEDQKALNMPMSGKAVNAIRSFPGEGLKVWGARTLDGNSQDWRYVNVRRTMIYLEQSVKNAARAYVFEPNDANTWINMKCMIENFLRSVWKRGGLAGAVPEDAYEVHIGLGDTMTADDILEGILRITVLVAVSHPAEFIEITFQQQMQKS